MNKKIKRTLTLFILLIVIMFYFKGVNAVLEFIKNIGISFWAVLKTLNLIVVQFTGDNILTLMFSSSVTFVIVGILLELFNISKGKSGSIFGKISFWLIGIPVSSISNIIVGLFVK